MEFDQLKTFFNCAKCNQLLVDPVTIASGKIVCKKHLDKLLGEGSMHESGSASKLNASKLMSLADECKDEIAQAKESVAKIEVMEIDPANYIYEYFEDFKRQVDLRREDLKLKVDEYSDKIIQSIESTQSKCYQLSEGLDQITTEIKQSKIELDELINRFETFGVNHEELSDIKQKLAVLKESFKRIIDDYEYSLTRQKDYTFDFKEVEIGDIFGSFGGLVKVELDSTIIEANRKRGQLMDLCEFPSETKWELRYRATRDGFKSTDYHSECDGRENTLTVIKTTSGNVFGGFAKQPLIWEVNRGKLSNFFVTDPNSFIFSLVNKEARPFKALCSDDGENALGLYHRWGPTFGSKCGSRLDPTFDFIVKSESNTNMESFSNFGSQFKHPDYPFGSDKAKTILAGSHQFQTVEIEVFTKID